MKSTLRNTLSAVVVIAAAAGIGIGVYWAATHRPAPSQAPVTVAQPAAPAAEKSKPATAETPLVRVFGIVTDAATGAAIDTAQLRARAERRDGDRAAVDPAESTTDASGAYEVRIEPDTYDAIVCTAPGYTRQRNALDTAGRAELRLDFQLVRGGTVTGHVTDKATGAPVEGIGVEVVGAQENAFERMRGRQNDPGRGGRSAADGTYVLDGVPAGSYRVTLDTRGSGYVYKPEDTVSLEIEAGKTYENVDFAIELGAQITGRVTNAQSGGPVPNAPVFAMPSQMIQRAMRRMSAGAMNGIGPNQTHTDENGEFVLRGLEFDSEYRATARIDGFAPGSSEIVRPERGKAAPRVEIALVRGSTVSGSVRYTDGMPAGGSELLLFPDSGEGWNTFIGPYPTRADDTGAFSFTNVAAGAFWLRAEGDFGGGIIGRASSSQNKATRVETDGVTDVTGVEVIIAKGTPKSINPPAQGSIKGTVIGGDGKPAPDVRVEARMVGNPAMSYGATTEADGMFELRELRGPVFDLSVNADEGIAKQAAVPVGANVTLRLTPPASLSGYVVDSAGDPVPGCSVRLANQDDAGKVASFISTMQNLFGARPGGQSTDANGAFEFTKLAPGNYVVTANSASRGTAESAPLAVAAGQDVTGVRITLDAGVTVSGTVVGPSGELVRGATVQLGPVTQDMAANLVSAFVPAGVLKTAGTTTTNERGEFTINQVAPGTYRLTASHSDYAKSIEPNFTVAAGHDVTGYRIALGKGGEARGTFSIDGKPQSGAMIVMLGESGVELVQTDSQGRFDVRGLTAGPHMIAAFDPARIAAGGAGMQFSPQVVDIPDGAAANIPDNPAANIALGGTGGVKVAGSIAGGDLGTFTLVALRKPDGTPLSDLDLTNFSNLLESLRSLGSQTVAGPDGAFSMENVPPGNYTLEVYTMDFDESNPDIGALLNLPRTPAYSHPVEIGPDQPPLQIDLSAP